MGKSNRSTTLRWQFIRQMLMVMIVIAVVSGAIQYYFLRQQINDNVSIEATMIGKSIEQGITETDLAARSIEQQIDYKLELISQRISDKLAGKTLDEITDQDLAILRNHLHIGGITLFARDGDDIIGVKSTDAKDIGFSLKNFGPDGFHAIDSLLKGEKPDGKGIVSYTSDHILSLYTAQSGSHNDEPTFNKYAYFHADGADYIINPFIEANEVYQFTKKVGPEAWIAEVLQENRYAKEIAVLDPRVFADPKLAEKMYPPLKKIVHGAYTYQDKQDLNGLIRMLQEPKMVTYVQKHEGKNIYKMFLPFDEGRVIYIALDYDKMSTPLYRHSMLLIIFGLLSLVALFVLTARFFNKIYVSIQQIIVQMKRLELGDLTAKSEVADGGELGDLSESTNTMADSLKQLLTDTHDKATKAQRLSVLLENEADQSVEKAFTMSMQTTSGAREMTEEINYFLDQIEEYALALQGEAQMKEILDKLGDMRSLARGRSNNTTEITITLSDLFKSLHAQSSELSYLSNSILKQLSTFRL